jgi:hypothetical protein
MPTNRSRTNETEVDKSVSPIVDTSESSTPPIEETEVDEIIFKVGKVGGEKTLIPTPPIGPPPPEYTTGGASTVITNELDGLEVAVSVTFKT